MKQNISKTSKNKKAYRVAVIGATGLVGTTILSILEERRFPIEQLYLVASARSSGELFDYDGSAYEVQDLEQFNFEQTELCFFCTGNDVASTYVPRALEAGNIVIDKSSYFRYHDDIPLIVPEVNQSVLQAYDTNLVANPNCTTIPISVALKPIYDAVGITRVNIATYQSVSGAGKEGVKELADQTVQLLNGHPATAKTFSQQIAFNVIPHIDDFEENGYTREEMKLVWELQKIFNDKQLAVNPTTVRVPVFYGHCAALHLETKEKLTAEEARLLLAKVPGLTLSKGKNAYPTPAKEAAGKDGVYVGRVREDLSCPLGLNLWVVADNLRKGAALNAVQIAEQIIQGQAS